MSSVSSYLGSRGYTILKECLDDDEQKILREELTVGAYIPKAPIQPPKFPIYRECSTKYYIPRYYGIKTYGDAEESRIQEGDDVSESLVFNGDMREYQNIIVNKYVNYVTANPVMGGGGLLDVDPGKGKTVMALNIISRLRKKTLVVVHKSFLLNQWIERIHQFLPAAKVGSIQGQTFDIDDKDIVIGMLQSLSMKDYPKDAFDSFGLSVYDECFTYNTCIHTNTGPREIGELYERWNDGHELPLILSYNQSTNTFEYKEMTYAWKKNTKELIQLSLTSSTITCTPNHKILTNRGYIAAMDLEAGDLVLCMRECIDDDGMDVDGMDDDGSPFTVLQKVYDWVVYTEIKSCKGEDERIDVYDIEVADNHNFVLATPKYNESMGQLFGLYPVVSNCHHMSAEVFCRCMMKVVTKYTLGLSGTMVRKDGLTKIFKYFLGDVIHKEKAESTHCVLVKGIQYKVNDPEFNETEYDYRGNPKFSTMISKVCDYNRRSEFILRVLENELRINPNQQVMILAHNKSLITYLYKAIEHRHIATVGYYIGGMKEAALKESESKKVIIATYAMASEGLDIKTLTTLIMASPKTDVCQSVGRILRVKHASPLVIDIIDPQDVFRAQWLKRQTYYIKQKYRIIMTDVDGYEKNMWTTKYEPPLTIQAALHNSRNHVVGEVEEGDDVVYDVDDNNNITVMTESVAKFKTKNSKEPALTGKCMITLQI